MLSQAAALTQLSSRIRARVRTLATSQIRTDLSLLPEASQLPIRRHGHRPRLLGLDGVEVIFVRLDDGDNPVVALVTRVDLRLACTAHEYWM